MIQVHISAYLLAHIFKEGEENGKHSIIPTSEIKIFGRKVVCVFAFLCCKYCTKLSLHSQPVFNETEMQNAAKHNIFLQHRERVK